jgi:hypothetical protein
VNKEVPVFKNILLTMKEEIHILGGKFFYGKFTTGSCKKYLLASPCPSFCPSDCLHVTPQEQICIKFGVGELLTIV